MLFVSLWIHSPKQLQIFFFYCEYEGNKKIKTTYPLGLQLIFKLQQIKLMTISNDFGKTVIQEIERNQIYH